MRKRDHVAADGPPGQAEQQEPMEVEDEYFEGYLRPSVHRVMLEDGPRMRAYRAAIFGADLRGKVVLDVGTGTGLLAMWAAQAGAARVIAVEASPMARLARENVEANGLHVVEVVEGRVEALQLGRVVDVIVSEWMGFHLVNESMLDSVLFARDAFLKRGGVLLPSAVRLLAAPVQCDDDVLFWGGGHQTGLDLSSVMRVAMAERCAVPDVRLVHPSALLAPPQVAVAWRLAELPREQAGQIAARLAYDVARDGSLTGLALWFDTDIGLDCAPTAPPTHWKQTVIYLPEYAQVEQGQPLVFDLLLDRDGPQSRSYSCHVAVTGWQGHEVDCACIPCVLVRGGTGEQEDA